MFNVVLFGATGATGKAVVDLLCGGKHSEDYKQHPAALQEADEGLDLKQRILTAFTRRAFTWDLVEGASKPFGNFRIDTQILDFNSLQDTLKEQLENLQRSESGSIDVVFCTHGTTAKQAGSDGEFIRIDHDMPLEMARQAKAAGVKHFSLVSAAMADSNSMFLYPRTKGRLVEDIKALGFERFSVFKPGLLIAGERPDSRFAESVAVALDPFVSWFGKTTGIKSLVSITVEDLAASMIANAMRSSPTPGVSYEEYETAPDILALIHQPVPATTAATSSSSSTSSPTKADL